MTPYGVEFARAVASRRYRRAILACSAQAAKTESLLDIIGHRLDQSPAPILYVGPNKQFLNEQFEPRVMALLDEAPSLRAKVARGKRMTKTRKVIAGVPFRLAHAGSSTALKSDPAALALTDEADELMANIKGQGDPIGLVDARGDTYGSEFVHAITSTPSVGMKETERDAASGLLFWKEQEADDLNSTIWKFWQAGTRHHWCWRCPSCEEWFVPRFDCLEFEGKGKETLTTVARAKQTAHLVCPNNGCVIHERDKEAMNSAGRYVAPGQTITPEGDVLGEPHESDAISFWVSGLCSPFQTFGDRAARYVGAVKSGDPEKVQTAVNAGFGEVWSPDTGESPDWEAVHECVAPYQMGDVPDGVLFLTAAIDVQKMKLVYVVRGWGVRSESWQIDAGEIHGDTRLDDVWLDAVNLIEGEYGGLPIRRVFIDSGFNPAGAEAGAGAVHKVYEFCRQHARLCYPTKGWEKRAQPLSVARIDVKPKGGKPKYGLDLVHLDSDFVKQWVHARVRWPAGEPGGWHLPADVTEEYCRQIANESRARKANGSGFTWIPRGPHDYLDAEAMAYAAARMLGLERIKDTRARQPARASKPANTEKQDDAPAPPHATPRRKAGWMGEGGGRASGWMSR